jgi:hypothetical protein
MKNSIFIKRSKDIKNFGYIPCQGATLTGWSSYSPLKRFVRLYYKHVYQKAIPSLVSSKSFLRIFI